MMTKINYSNSEKNLSVNSFSVDTSWIKNAETSRIIKQALQKKSIQPSTPFYPKDFVIDDEEIEKNSLLNQVKNSNTSKEILSLIEQEYQALRPDQQQTTEDLHFHFIRLVANLACAGLITGGEGELCFEGSIPVLNFKTWQWLLDKIDPNDFSPSEAFQKIKDDVEEMLKHVEDLFILSQQSPISNLTAYAQAANKIAQKIHHLKPGQYTSLYIGWNAKGGEIGHAMIMRVEKNALIL